MKALVTGGGGFLGGAIVRLLLARGDRVRTLARGEYPDLARQGVDARRGDVADAAAARGAVQGCDVVFHTAGKSGVGGTRAEFERTNVDGTRQVLEACRAHGVAKLVYTSTPSVVSADGDLAGADESLPYPDRFEAEYPRTKALAERMVLAANGPALATVALRPHLIWGPGDTQLAPRIIERAKAGRLRQVGGGQALIDTVYVDNAAEAHLLAADRLGPGSPVAGKAYFITQGQPIPVGDMINAILAAAGLPPVTRSVSPGVAYAAGWALEVAHRALGRTDEPRMTRFLARQLGTAHWFDISAARRDLGYSPRISTEEGLRRLAQSLRGAGSRP